MWYIHWGDVTKSLHLMNDSIGVGHAGLVCHLRTPHLPYDFIDLLLDAAWRNNIPSVKQSLSGSNLTFSHWVSR